MNRIGHAWSVAQTLAYRDIKVRYAQTALGAVWAIAQPLGMAAVLWITSYGVGQKESFPALFAGWIVWSAFSFAGLQGGLSLVNNLSLVQKTPIPHLAYPLSKALVASFDAAVGLFVLLLFQGPSGMIVFIPLLWSLLLGFGFGTWMALLTTRSKDLLSGLPFLFQMLFFLTPVWYSAPTHASWIQWNPLSSPVIAAKQSISTTLLEPTGPWALSVAFTIVLFITGPLALRHIGKNSADFL